MQLNMTYKRDSKKSLLSANSLFYLVLLFLTILFICFPSHNMTLDAISYAADVKWGRDLFYPHHLLFNALHWCCLSLVRLAYAEADVLSVMLKVMAFFAIGCIWMNYKTLQRITTDSAAATLSILAACCFGFLRYTLECEVYVIPIFFSMASSYWFIRYIKECKIYQVVLMGIFASIAVLFHQIHIFWGIGLCIGLIASKQYKATIIYSVCTLSVLVVYSIVLVKCLDETWSINNLFHFLASYYYTSAASESGIGLKNLLMSPISFVRTFIQVHGDIAIKLRLSPCLYATFAIIPLLGYSVYMFIKKGHLREQIYKNIAWPHITIFILQLLFAVYSDGNNEFMVLLPFVLTIIIASSWEITLPHTLLIAGCLFVWNFAFAIWPDHHYNYYNEEYMADYLYTHPTEEMVTMTETIYGIYYYKYGEADLKRLIKVKESKPNNIYITDLIDRPMPFNRQKFIHTTPTNFVILDTIVTIDADYGQYHLYRVQNVMTHKCKQQCRVGMPL